MRRAAPPIALAAAFGAADQYLGSRGSVLGSWAIDASLLSAPWLLVAFFAGWSQPTTRRGVILGLVCTFAALGGYWAMTLSPIEGAQISVRGVRGLLFSQSLLVAGALLTGPLFGWFGNRWRTRRDWVSALAAALAVCCEPLAHAAVGTAVSFRGVWAAEAVTGVLMVLYVINKPTGAQPANSTTARESWAISRSSLRAIHRGVRMRRQVSVATSAER